MRGAIVLFLTLYLLQALVGQANHALSGAHVYLFEGGLFVAYSALVRPFGPGLVAAILAGLLCDAAAPVAFGTHALLFAAAHAIVYNLRARLPRDEAAVQVLVALVANLALFVALSFLQVGRGSARVLAWPRLSLDLACSEAALGLAAPWFFALQERTLRMAGIESD